MEAIGQHDVALGSNISAGQRRCPNPECHGHMFVVFNGNAVAVSYPPVRLDFDPQNIPKDILKTFEEAITCHASKCYVASAIMVRRTLEELCEHSGAQGKDLRTRITDLGTKIVVPKELLEAMDELRILGNDAAHIEAKAFENISEAEIDVALEFTKEILKSVFQYSALLQKLRALKKQP